MPSNQILQTQTAALVHKLDAENGTTASGIGDPITKIKFRQVGSHEGLGRFIQLGPHVKDPIKIGLVVRIRFLGRIRQECNYCVVGREQYCAKSRDHLYYEDGSFQRYYVIDARYLAALLDGLDPRIQGPVLCASVTAYKAVLNANIRPGQYIVILGAGAGLGKSTIQFGIALRAKVIAVDSGNEKKALVKSHGVEAFVDFCKD